MSSVVLQEASREKLFRELEPRAVALADRISRRPLPPAIDVDDLRQQARIALYRELGSTFYNVRENVEGIMLWRVERRLIDYLRSHGYWQRSRKRDEEGNWISPEKSPEFTFSLDVEVNDEYSDGTYRDLLRAPEKSDPALRLDPISKQALTEAIGKLEGRYQKIVFMLYVKGMNMEEVGAELGVTSSRISQLHSTIVDQLEFFMNHPEAESSSLRHNELRHKRVPREEEKQEAAGGLRSREVQTLIGAARGETGIETAERLFLAPETVKTYRKNVIAKLGTRNMMQAVAVGALRGIITPEQLGLEVDPESDEEVAA